MSIIKLQSLLDLALNNDVHGDEALFREDVKVTMATTGLYEWLMKVVGESGQIGDEIDPSKVRDEKKEKERDEKKPLLGEFSFYLRCALILPSTFQPLTH